MYFSVEQCTQKEWGLNNININITRSMNAYNYQQTLIHGVSALQVSLNTCCVMASIFNNIDFQMMHFILHGNHFCKSQEKISSQGYAFNHHKAFTFKLLFTTRVTLLYISIYTIPNLLSSMFQQLFGKSFLFQISYTTFVVSEVSTSSSSCRRLQSVSVA